MSLFHRGPHGLEMQREEHGHTGESDQGWPGKKTIDVGKRVAKKITVSGDYTYIAEAVIGSDQADAVWSVFRVDESVAGDTVITWAGGGLFNQVATDLTSLSYA
jgi:hypothetical protein